MNIMNSKYRTIRARASFACLIAILSFIFLGQVITANAQSSTLANGTYTVTSGSSGLLWDDPNSSTQSLTNIDLKSSTGGENQHWIFTSLSGGYYEIVNASSGLALNDSGASKTAGALLIQYPWGSGANNAEWSLTASGKGYIITNRSSGLVVDPNANTSGADIDQEPANGSAGQIWLISAISSNCTPTAITPYIQVNGAAWQASSTASVTNAATVNLGPQPLGGTWSWTGPNGFTSTAREIDGIPLSAGTDTFVATYTNASGCNSTQTFTITVTGNATGTTAWQNGAFNVDVANVVAQSNIILQAPNTGASDAMPLGNGNVGAAIWSANGMTIQVNRNDTFPERKSLGWVVIPGLSALTGGSGYSGKVDLYNGQFTESGGGMTATVFVRHDKDEIVIDVTGANPNNTQTAQIQLWSGRSPVASASGVFAALAETFVDNSSSVVSSGQTFGSLAGITAWGQDVTASVINSTTVQLSFKPNSDGTFRILVAAPSYNGSQNAMTTVTNLIGSDTTAATSSLQSATTAWWNSFWAQTGLINITSSDGGGAYVENIRDVNLFLQAASSSGQYPGHHAGLADMFRFGQDSIPWDPSLFWHWNLRMFVGSNMAAGHPELNTPYFNLYTSNLSNLEDWTKEKFTVGNGSNICVPEIMRFNGNGSGSGNETCWPAYSPDWDALTLTTGAEVSNWIWLQYLYTGDTAFLSANYPTMAASARFLLEYSTVKSDGMLHTFPTNAHEDQWGIDDSSINDVSAMKALFPATIQAAQILNTDAALVTQLQAALPKILDYPRTDIATQKELLTATSDAGGTDMLGTSYVPTASFHNIENDNLEPVWPFGLIGDSSSLTALALRTFQHRSFVNEPDWTFDAVQAARLGNSSGFYTSIQDLITSYQVFPAGIGSWEGSHGAFYDEMGGGLTNAVQEALVQDYDGLLRIAPAWPSGNWNVSGTVYIQGNSKVHVQIENSQLVTAVVEAGSMQNIVTRNPWGTQSVQVVDGSSGATVVAATTASQFTIPAQSGHAYVIELVSSPTTALPYAQVTATPATAARAMWGQKIGIQ
jgi:hypothetical protein